MYYLMHYAKGSSAKDTKYIERKWENGRWVYTYNPVKDRYFFTDRNTGRMTKEGKARLKELKKDTESKKQNYENLLNSRGNHKVGEIVRHNQNDPAYRNDKSRVVEKIDNSQELIYEAGRARAKESQARKEHAEAFAYQRRMEKLAEEEREEFKQLKREKFKMKVTELPLTIVNKTIDAINNLFNKKDSVKHDDIDDSLCHIKKGTELSNHKYRSREFKDGKWVYDYGDGKQERPDGQSTQISNTGSSNVSNNSSEKLHSVSDKYDKLKEEAINDDNSYIDEEFVNNYIDKSEERAKDYRSYLDRFDNMPDDKWAQIMGNEDTQQYKDFKACWDALEEYEKAIGELNDVNERAAGSNESSDKAEYFKCFGKVSLAKRNLDKSIDVFKVSINNRRN